MPQAVAEDAGIRRINHKEQEQDQSNKLKYLMCLGFKVSKYHVLRYQGIEVPLYCSVKVSRKQCIILLRY